MGKLSKYRAKSFSWWLATPFYAARHLRNLLGLQTLFIRVPKEEGNPRSANNEDQIIAALLNQTTGYCVEVGAYEGVQGSNSLLFERRGWKCLLVEADPEMAQLCAKQRPLATTFSAAAVAPSQVGRVTFQLIPHNRPMSSLSFDEAGIQHFQKHGVEFQVTPVEIEARTLDSMLEEANFPVVDFVTIDVEGHELEVLQGFDLERWQPRLIMLERIQKTPDPNIAAILSKHQYQHILTVPLGAIDDCNDLYYKARS